MSTKSVSLTLTVVAWLVSANPAVAAGEGGVPDKGWSPFQFAIFNPIQLVGEEKSINGLRLSLVYGKNTEVNGVDIGLVNRFSNLTGIQIGVVGNFARSIIGPGKDDVVGTVKGIQIGGLGNEADNLYGIQLGGWVNFANNDATAIQVAIFGNGVNGTMKGIQIGAINNAFFTRNVETIGIQIGGINAAKLTGIQLGGVNVAFLTGVQVGFVNAASLETRDPSSAGVQIGLFNYGSNITGVQFGLFNWCEDLYGIQIGLLNYIEKGSIPWMPILNAKF